MTRTASLALPLLLIGLAGCVGDDDAGGPVDDPLSSLDVDAYAVARLLQSHDHGADAAEHTGIIGFEPIGFGTAQGVLGGADTEGYGELAVKGRYAYLSAGAGGAPLADGVGLTTEGYGGFVIFDLADPAAPEPVGRWKGEPLGDLEVTDDNVFAFASTQRNGYPFTWTLPPGTPADGALPRGTAIVDVSDPRNPVTVAFAPLPTNGPHTVNYEKLPNGRELLLAATYDILFTTYPDDIGQNKLSQKIIIYDFIRAPVPRLVPLSIFTVIEPDPSDGRLFFPHDATVHVASDGRIIMDVAYWDMGLVMVDITDPANPVELSRFDDTAPSAYVSTHLVRVFPGTIGNRTIAVLEPEIPGGDDTGTLTFVDVTDPAKPEKLGTWMMPGELIVDAPFNFSPHNFDLVCGGMGQVTGLVVDYAAPCENPVVLLSHNHGGLWALDASDPTAPQSLGFFFPAPEAGRPVPYGFGTVFVQNGVIYAPEYRTGLHTLRLADLVV